MLAGMFTTLKPEIEANAANSVATPTFTLKRVNKGTGVKIIINKTKGATGYYIYMTKRDNAYSSYLYNGGEYEEEIAEVKKNGKAKRIYTIKGLQKGTYSFKVLAYAEENIYDSASGKVYTDTDYSDYSAVQSIYVKAAKKKSTTEKTYDFSKAKVGDIIKFGSYEQDDDMTNGKEEIEWIVLAKDSKRIFVMSKYSLDSLPYNSKKTDITWEDCTLRKWLNDSFYKNAFTKKERTMINTVKLKNDDNPYYGIEGGNDTKDKIFLLSLGDILNSSYGFDSDSSKYDILRRCAPTAYAKIQGAWSSEMFYIDSFREKSLTIDGEISWWWWLRSPGGDTHSAALVEMEGRLDKNGISVTRSGNGFGLAIRPALYINIKS